MWYTVRYLFFSYLWRSWCGNDKSPCALHCDGIWHRLSLWKKFETTSIRADQSGTSKLQRDIRKGSLWETKMHAISLNVTFIPPLQHNMLFNPCNLLLNLWPWNRGFIMFMSHYICSCKDSCIQAFSPSLFYISLFYFIQFSRIHVVEINGFCKCM